VVGDADGGDAVFDVHPFVFLGVAVIVWIHVISLACKKGSEL
jgi:hypothetical protein